MGISLEKLRGFVAIGQAAQRAVDQVVDQAHLHPHPRVLSFVDQTILARLPITFQVTYRHGDQWDAAMTRSRLHTCGSIVDAVSLEIAAELLRERRAGR